MTDKSKFKINNKSDWSPETVIEAEDKRGAIKQYLWRRGAGHLEIDMDEWEVQQIEKSKSEFTEEDFPHDEKCMSCKGEIDIVATVNPYLLPDDPWELYVYCDECNLYRPIFYPFDRDEILTAKFFESLGFTVQG